MNNVEERKVVISFWATETQKKELDDQWKQTPDCYKRSDFIREAINQASNKKIF